MDDDAAPEDQDAPLDYLAQAPGGPVPSPDALRSIVARYRRRRTRVMGIAVAVAVVAGPAAGFAIGQAVGSDDGDAQTVTAGSFPTQAGERVDAAVSSERWSSGSVQGFISGWPGEGPTLTRVFVRDTADGIRVRAYTMGGAYAARGAPPGMEPSQSACFPPGPLIQAQVSDDLVVSSGGSRPIFGGSQEADPIAVVGSATDGVLEGSEISTVKVRAAPQVARVRVTFGADGTDEMAPVDGWAVLARHTSGAYSPPSGSVEAFDADGRLLATVDLAALTYEPPPECRPPEPLLPSDGGPDAIVEGNAVDLVPRAPTLTTPPAVAPPATTAAG